MQTYIVYDIILFLNHQKKYSSEVEKIWRQQHGTDSIIGRIGPHTISDTSIIQLKSLVSDDVSFSLYMYYIQIYHCHDCWAYAEMSCIL